MTDPTKAERHSPRSRSGWWTPRSGWRRASRRSTRSCRASAPGGPALRSWIGCRSMSMGCRNRSGGGRHLTPEVPAAGDPALRPRLHPGHREAIQRSDLGLTPSNDGQLIRIVIPQLTEERRHELTKLCARRAEEARVRCATSPRRRSTISARSRRTAPEPHELERSLEQVQHSRSSSSPKLDDVVKKRRRRSWRSGSRPSRSEHGASGRRGAWGH